MEYEGKRVLRSERVELRKLDHLNLCHRNRNRLATGLLRYACGKGILRWKIIHHPQGYVNTFELWK